MGPFWSLLTRLDPVRFVSNRVKHEIENVELALICFDLLKGAVGRVFDRFCGLSPKMAYGERIGLDGNQIRQTNYCHL